MSQLTYTHIQDRGWSSYSNIELIILTLTLDVTADTYTAIHIYKIEVRIRVREGVEFRLKF